MRLAWCDKLALAWALFLVLFILWAQQPGGFERSLQWENVGAWWSLLWKLALIPWLALRFLDLCFDGPNRRQSVIRVRRI